MDAVTPFTVFTIFGVSVSSTVVATWAAMAIIIGSVIILGKFKPLFLQDLVDFLSNLVSDIMNIESVEPYLPFLGSLAIFLAVANIFGSFPLFSSPTSDLSTPVALALVVFFTVHVFGVRSQGFFGYLKDLASPIFMLPLEIVSQISRTISLAARLFGNILSGDLIVAVIMSLVPLFVPVVMMGLSLLIGLLQAYVFTALASVYIASALEVTAGEMNQ